VLKKLSAFIPVALAVAMLATATPAGANDAGGGVVVGRVAVTPNITLAGAATLYRFASTAIDGVITANNGAVRWIGSVLVSASGRSAWETLNGAHGTVAVAAFGPAGTLPGGTGALSSRGLSGTFNRIGPLVIVTLGGPLTIGAALTVLSPIAVVAVFVPNATQLAARSVRDADFAGVFAGIQ